LAAAPLADPAGFRHQGVVHPCCELYQDGSDGVTVLFDVADFDQMAAIIRPRRRRRLSEARRLACAEHLAKVRPQTLIKVGK
jgi:hypothetical protein